eukprot:sb/3476277/
MERFHGYMNLLRFLLLTICCCSVGLAAPLQCSICELGETYGDSFDHYTNITVYSKPGDVIIGDVSKLFYFNLKMNVGLAAPLQCSICELGETYGDSFDHYTNITVYSKPGDVIIGGKR